MSLVFELLDYVAQLKPVTFFEQDLEVTQTIMLALSQPQDMEKVS